VFKTNSKDSMLDQQKTSNNADAALEAALDRIRQLSASDRPGKTEPSSFSKTADPSLKLAELKSTVQNVAPNNANSDKPADKSKPAAPNRRKQFKLTDKREEPLIPLEPATIEDSGINNRLIEEIITKFLLSIGEATGRGIADQLKIPFRLVEPVLLRMKAQQLLGYVGSTAVHDYIHVLTDAGRERARRFNQACTYFGSAPVPIDEYIESVGLQSLEKQHPSRDDLARAFSDLLIPPRLLARLGPAVNSGRGMFLYGYPGNGKTSIAERVTRAFGDYIWVPRAVVQEGSIMRIFDPQVHEEAPHAPNDGFLIDSPYDQRWVRIKRPTIIAGGELTMEMLEVHHNHDTHISDAPLQLKSNCGVLLIDDFGRQRMSVDELLNRWIVPLEKRYDFLSISGSKKTQVPFDQLVIFSTNLEPKNLVDDAFLRRIPYKIEVQNPTEDIFRKLFEIMARVLKVPYDAACIEYLIERHYRPLNRPYRNCHPRDLLLQIKAYCHYNQLPMTMKPELFDFAVENYFSIM
jgi:hypothetical protein